MEKYFDVLNETIITDKCEIFDKESNENSQILFTQEKEEDIYVFKIKASIEKQRPFFGPQIYFSQEECIKIELSFIKETPMLCLYQHKHWWIRPSFINSNSEIPKRTQLLMWKENTKYYVLMALSGKHGRSDFAGGPGNLIISYTVNTAGIKECEDILGVMICADNPYECIKKATKKALELTSKNRPMRENTKLPEIFDYLGWCTWDAFYQDVNEREILEKMEEFKNMDIPIRWVLIDDGWSKADYKEQELIGFDCDPIKFPDGIKKVVEKIKTYKNVMAVGVWQASMGYWNGIKPASKVENYQKNNLLTMPDKRVVVIPSKENVFSFWDKWHSHLSDAGISFVKVDGQSALRHFYKSETLTKTAQEWHTGIENSVVKNFEGNIINCMGMASENFWNRPLSILSRSSDDFVPDKENGYIEHALQNAYNALLHTQLYWPDWDMFWSKHDQVKQNAMQRAVSGGPVYISDAIGKTDKTAIFPLIQDDGKIYKCDDVGLPTVDCLLVNPETSKAPLKIFNKVRDSFVILAINLNENANFVSGNICSENIPELSGKDFYIYDFNKREVSFLTEGEIKEIQLTKGESNIYTIIPTTCELSNNLCVLIGLTKKYICTKSIENIVFDEGEVSFSLLYGGEFSFITKMENFEVLINDKPIEVIRNGSYCTFDCEGQENINVEIIYK